MRRLKTVRRPPIYPNGAQAISPVAPSPLFCCPHAVHRWIRAKEKDPDLYEEIHHEVMMYVGDDLAAMVQVAESGREYSAGKTTRKKKSRATSKAPTDGFCIRCKITLPANPTKPYCTHCYASWKRYENAAYEEKHCHTCGKEHAATQIKPVCPTCYKKYQGVLKFAAS